MTSTREAPVPPAVLQQRTGKVRAARPQHPAPARGISGQVGRWLEQPSPLLKQAPFTALFILGLALSRWTNLAIQPDGVALLISSAIIGSATAFAVVVTLVHRLSRLNNLIAAADFVAILELRHATGDSKSVFGILVVIPLLWMAGNLHRRYVAYAGGGVALVFVPPLLVPGVVEADPSAVIRTGFAVVTFSLAALVVNELARQARRRFDVIRAHERAYAAEIEQGGVVQQALLPRAEPIAAGYQVTGACIPAALVGGDFYDWYATADGIGFTLGDVMGKGVGASIIAATARAVIRSARDHDDPTVALRWADASLSDELGDVGAFATIFHARLQVETGRVSYSDAGHGLTMHLHSDGTWQRLPSSGVPLGIGFASGWDAREITLAEGDTLISVSDGVLDFYDGSLSTLDHLADIAHRAASADELVASIERLAEQVDHDDDVTVVVVRRISAPALTA